MEPQGKKGQAPKMQSHVTLGVIKKKKCRWGDLLAQTMNDKPLQNITGGSVPETEGKKAKLNCNRLGYFLAVQPKANLFCALTVSWIKHRSGRLIYKKQPLCSLIQ